MSLQIRSGLNGKNDIGNKPSWQKVDAADKTVSKNADNIPDNKIMPGIAQKVASQEELKELMRQFDMFDDENILDPKIHAKQTEEQVKIASAKSKIKRELTYAADNINRSAINELISSGVSLEKISLDMLNSIVREITEKPEAEVLNAAADEIADKLSGTELSDASIAALLKSGKTLSLENIYSAKFSGADTESAAGIDEEVWEALKPEVERFFDRHGIEKNDADLEIAKLLLAYKMPVTKQNIDKADFLRNLNKNIKTLGENDRLIDDVSEIKLETVDIALKKKIPLTLKNLITENGGKFENPEAEETLSAESVTAKRQLMEIQLKLTKESAYRLAENNIEIDTLPLENAVAELRKIESDELSKSLRIMDTPTTPRNIEKMNGLFNMVSSFKLLSNSVYGDLMQKKTEFTIDGIDNSFKMSEKIADLEMFATAANPKYGDSFKRIYRQIAPLLEHLNIPPTESNIKAASILSRNKIDINEENIKAVSAIDGKINRIYNTLHPNIAAKMIKDGLAPEYMHIDDVQRYIDEFNGKYGEDLGDKISRYIMEADKQSIDAKTREGMIEIYKMLHRIQKNEAAAVGVLYKNGIDLTLGKLLQGAGYYSKTQGNRGMVDIAVDLTAGERINFEYNSQRVRDFTESSAPNRLSAIINKREDIYGQNLDDIISALQNVKEEFNKEVIVRKINETVKSLAKSPAETIGYLQESGMDITVGNIMRQTGRMRNYGPENMDKIEKIEENENEDKRALQIKKLQNNIDFHRAINLRNQRDVNK